MKYLLHLLLGIFFGLVLIKSEVVSWFRIYEMFMFQSFHMYGIIGSAIFTASISIWLIKRQKIKTIAGENIDIQPKPFLKFGNFAGGVLFGLGWAFTGACPAPIYALIGNGSSVFILVLLSAYLGVFVYGLLKRRLPH